MKLGELELSFVERQRRVNLRQFHGFSPHYPRCATREPSASGRWSKNQIVTPAAAVVYEHTKLCQMLFLPQSRERRLFYATSQPLLITFSEHFRYYFYFLFFFSPPSIFGAEHRRLRTNRPSLQHCSVRVFTNSNARVVNLLLFLVITTPKKGHKKGREETNATRRQRVFFVVCLSVPYVSTSGLPATVAYYYYHYYKQAALLQTLQNCLLERSTATTRFVVFVVIIFLIVTIIIII